MQALLQRGWTRRGTGASLVVRAGDDLRFPGFVVDGDLHPNRAAADRAVFDVVLFPRAAQIDIDVDPFPAIGAPTTVGGHGVSCLVKTVRGRAGPA